MKTNKTYNNMQRELGNIAADKERRINELEGYVAYLERQQNLYRDTIKNLEAKIEELKNDYKKQRNKRIDELQKENAKLKAVNEELKNYHRNENK